MVSKQVNMFRGSYRFVINRFDPYIRERETLNLQIRVCATERRQYELIRKKERGFDGIVFS